MSISTSASFSTSASANVTNSNNMTNYLINNLGPAVNPTAYKAYMQSRRDANPLFFTAKPAVRNPLTNAIVGHLVGSYNIKLNGGKPKALRLSNSKVKLGVTNHSRSKGGVGTIRPDGTEVLNYNNIKTPHKGIDKGAAWNLGTSKKSRNKAANRARLNARIFTANRADRLSGCRTASNGIGTGHNSRNTFSPIAKAYTASGTKQYVRVYRCEAEPLATPLVLNVVEYPTFKPVQTSYQRKLSRRWLAARAEYKANRRGVNRDAFTLEAVLRLLDRAKVARVATVAQHDTSSIELATFVCTSFYTGDWSVRFATVFEDCFVDRLVNDMMPPVEVTVDDVMSIHNSLFGHTQAEPFGMVTEEEMAAVLGEHSELLTTSRGNWGCDLKMALRRSSTTRTNSMRTANRANKSVNKSASKASKASKDLTPALAAAKATWITACKVRSKSTVAKRIAYATKLYNQKGFNASESTYSGYVAKLYGMSQLKAEYLVDADLMAEITSLLEEGLKAYEVAEQLGITSLEAYAVYHYNNNRTMATSRRSASVTRTYTRTAKQSSVNRTAKQSSVSTRRQSSTVRKRPTRVGAFKLYDSDKLVVDAPLNVNQIIEELNQYPHLFTLNSGTEELADTDKYVMALVPFMADCGTCNVNVHTNVIPSNKKNKYETYMFSNDNAECKEIPVGNTPSAEYKAAAKEEDGKFRDKSPLTFRPGRVHTNMLGKSGKTYLKWGDACFTNFNGLDDLFGSRVSTYILFNSKVEGKSDLADRQAGSKSVGETAAEIRAVLRDAILNGHLSDGDIEFLADHGNSVEVSLTLNHATETGDPVPGFDGESSDRHYMLVLGRVESVIDERRRNEDKVGGQYRLLCDTVMAWYIPSSSVEDVCDLTRLSARNEFFPVLGDPIFDVKVEEKKETTSRRTRKPAASTTTKKVVETPIKEVVQIEDELTAEEYWEAEGVIVNMDKPEVEPEVKTDEDVVVNLLNSYSEELDALYTYMDNPVDNKRNEEFWTVKDVLESFGVRASKDQKVSALSVLYPDVAVDTLEELVSVNDKGAKWSKAQRVADAVRFYIYGHLSGAGADLNVDPVALPILDYTWTLEDLEDMVNIIHQMMARDKGTRKRHSRKATTIEDAIRLDGNKLLIDGQLAFSFEDGIAYDYRGRAFANTLVMTTEKNNKGQKTGKVDTVLAGSFTNFIYFFYMGYLPLLANWKGNSGIYSNTFENMKAVLDGCGHLFKMTTDKVYDQNGGALHGLTSTYSPLMYDDYSPLKSVKDKKRNVVVKSWFSLGSKAAKNLVKHYSNDIKANLSSEFADMMSGGSTSDLESNLGSMIEAAMESAHLKYGLDFHFTKGQYVRGTLGHINLAMVKRFCPNLFATLVDHLGAEVTAKKVISNTIKASKGLKRVMLSLAQAATVVDEKNAGWRLYNQKKAVAGALVKVALAPTIVCAPGMSAWIGSESDMPVAIVDKRIKYVRNDYELEDNEVFDFTSSTLDKANVCEWTTVEESDGWSVTKPSKTIQVNGTGKERICDILGGEPLYHEYPLEGDLLAIRWQEQVSIDNKESELVIEYAVRTYEHHGKLRSIGKGQYFKTDASLIHNSLNDMDINADLIMFQDVIKSDTLYSWLMVAANTIYHNHGKCESKEYLDMVAEVISINRKVIGHPNLVNNIPQLVIEPTAIAAGIYTRLQEMFAAAFGKTIWVKWEQAQTMTDIVYNLYTNKVNADSTNWVATDVSNFPELKSWAGDRDIVVYQEDEVLSETTNVLAFIVADGKPVAYAQRGRVLAGTSEMPLYNVELFESSTVKEAISSSTGLIAYIKALSAVVGQDDKVLLEQQSMIDDGMSSVMTAKLLAAAVGGNLLDVVADSEELVESGLQVLPIKAKGSNLIFSDSAEYDDVYNELMSGLASVGIDVDDIKVYEKGFFRKLAYAARNIVFTFNTGGNAELGESPDKTSFWLPALYSLSKLTSKSDENRDFISMFVFDILVPLIEEKSVKAKILLQVRGILESFMNSKNTIKFMNGRRCAGAKRIALPNIPCGETWVLFSQDTNSFYQELIRCGFPVNDFDAVAEGIVVQGNRAPMPAGPVGRIRLVMSEEVDGVMRQRLVPFNGEDAPTEYLLHELSPVQVGVDVMSVNLDGGDYDGDGHYLTHLKHLGLEHLTSFERVWELRSAAIGMDMFSANCGSYAADHYGIKSWGKATLTLTNLKTAIKKYALKDAKEYVSYNRNAFTLQTKAVGVMYGVYMMGEILISLVNGAKAAGVDYPSSLEFLTGNDALYLVLVLAEIYEIMLGGYDEAPYQLYVDYLKAIMDNEDYVTSDQLMERYPELNGQDLDVPELHIYNITQLLKEMGASAGQAKVVYTIFNLIADALAVNKNKKAPYDFIKDEESDQMVVDNNNLNLNNFIYTALVSFELSRGRFEGFSGVLRDKGASKKAKGQRYALGQALNFVNDLKDTEEGNEFIDKNVTLYGLNQVNRYLYDELTSSKATQIAWYSDELNYFTDRLGTVEEVTVVEPELELDLSLLAPVNLKTTSKTVDVQVSETEEEEVAKPIVKAKAKVKDAKTSDAELEVAAPICAPIDMEEDIELATPIAKAKHKNKIKGEDKTEGEAKVNSKPKTEAFTPVFKYVTSVPSSAKVDNVYQDEEVIQVARKATKPVYKANVTKEEVIVELAGLLADSGNMSAEDLLDKLREIADSKVVEESTDTVSKTEPKVETKVQTKVQTKVEEESVQAIRKASKPTKASKAVSPSVKTEKIEQSKQPKVDETMDKEFDVIPQGPADLDYVSAPIGAPVEEENIPTASKLPTPAARKGNSVKSEPRKLKQITSTPARNIEEQEVVSDEKALTNPTVASDFAHELICQLKSKGASQSVIDGIKSLTAEQLIVIQEVVAGHHVCLTGEGGCGKSYTVQVLRNLFDYLKWDYFVAGSTGTSVMNVEGDGTFNSLFGLGLGFARSEAGYASDLEDYRSLVTKARHSQVISYCKNRAGKHRPLLVIVDEVSMVDTRMLNIVQEAAEKEGVNLQWLTVGDPLQFLPVKGTLFFKDFVLSTEDEVEEGTSLIKRLEFTVVELMQNIRAKGDTELVSALNQLRLGKKINSIFRKRFNASVGLSDSDKAEMIHMYYNNNLVKNHNELMTQRMIEGGAKSKTYRAKIQNFSGKSGWHLKNAKGDEDTTVFDPISMEMTLCVGMPVMIRMNLKNDAGSLKAANGTLGTINSLMENAVTVKLKDGTVIRVDSCPLHAPTDRKGKPIGEFKQLPLHPAFALTMHKVQGCSFDQPVMVHAYQMTNKGEVKPISRYAPNSLYVACSRVTKREWLHFATDLSHLDIEVSSASMWSMLKASYHTDKDALSWVKSISSAQ